LSRFVPRHLAIAIHALHGGGAERVASQLANHWVRAGHEVTLITLDEVGTDHFATDEAVHRVGLGVMGSSTNWLQAVRNNRARIKSLRKAIQAARPAVVLSLTDRMNVMTLMAARRLTVPVVIAEHSDPRHQLMPRPWELLRRWTYPHCAAAVALTDAVAEVIKKWTRGRPLKTIPNSLQPPGRYCSDSILREGRTLLAMGRLSREKGFDRLIRAFGRIAAQHSDWRLRIAGEGPERETLTALKEELNLGRQVELCGWVGDVESFLCSGSLFALSSIYEGFPMALLEAMACGLPVVSVDCDSGPRAIIRPDQNGILVPRDDEQALAKSLDRMMSDPRQRMALGREARQVADEYCWSAIADRWERLWQDILPPSG